MSSNIFKKLHQQQQTQNRNSNPHNKTVSNTQKQQVFGQITNIQNNNLKIQTNLSKINRTEGSPPPISNQKRQHTEPSPNCFFKYRPKSQNKETENQNLIINNNQVDIKCQKENIQNPIQQQQQQQQQNPQIQVKFINVQKAGSPKNYIIQQQQQQESQQKQNQLQEHRNSNFGIVKSNQTYDIPNQSKENQINEQLTTQPIDKTKLQQSQSQLNLQQSLQQNYFISNNLQESFQNPIQQINQQINNQIEESKQSQDSINSINSISCTEHPEKKAKYYTINDITVIYLCSKCAIDGALKGHRVVELKELKEETNQVNSKVEDKPDKLTLDDVYKMKGLIQQNFTQDQLQRKLEVEKFIIQLENLCTQCDYSLEFIYCKKNEINKLLEEQKVNVEKAFNEYLQILQQEKVNIIQKLEKQIQNSKGLQSKNESKIQQFQNDMSNIKSDIFQNIDNILLNMDIKPFRNIISKYSEKIKSYEKQNEVIKIEQTSQFVSLNNELNFTKLEQEYKQSVIQNLSQCQYLLNNKLESKDIKIVQNQDNRINSMYISFENKDMFENAVKAADKGNIKIVKQESLVAPISQSPEIKSKYSPAIKEDLISNIIKSPNNAKYLDLLEKVNQNQTNTNNFYSNIIKEHTITSPDKEIICQKRCTTPQNNVHVQQNLNNNDKTYRKDPKTGKEQQNQSKKYDHFMQFIESKLNDGQNKNQQHSNYQKTLFSSPHFKEDDQTSKQKLQRYA